MTSCSGKLYSRFWHKMMAQIVAKSLTCLLIDEFNTSGNFLTVRRADMIFLLQKLSALLYPVLFLSDGIREGRGEGGRWETPSSTQRFCDKMEWLTEPTEWDSNGGIPSLHLPSSAARSHNRDPPAVFWSLPVRPVCMHTGGSSNAIDKRKKIKL